MKQTQKWLADRARLTQIPTGQAPLQDGKDMPHESIGQAAGAGAGAALAMNLLAGVKRARPRELGISGRGEGERLI